MDIFQFNSLLKQNQSIYSNQQWECFQESLKFKPTNETSTPNLKLFFLNHPRECYNSEKH